MSFSLLPLLVTLTPALLLLLQLPDYSSTQEDYKHGHRDPETDRSKHFCSWKCLLFTLQWPGAFCQALDKPYLCVIPSGISDWTIHGLWPIHAWGCCDCWPMFHSDVQEVEAELNQHWPSLLTIQPSFHFWLQEWHKHGVCAACVEGMNSPLRYFQICLKLRRRFDLHQLLDQAGIVPSCKRLYKLQEVHQVLAPHLGDHVEIQCVTNDQGREVWFQVKIPLSRNLTVGCDRHGDAGTLSSSSYSFSSSPGHSCPPDQPFFFLPIDHQQPRRPCG